MQAMRDHRHDEGRGEGVLPPRDEQSRQDQSEWAMPQPSALSRIATVGLNRRSSTKSTVPMIRVSKTGANTASRSTAVAPLILNCGWGAFGAIKPMIAASMMLGMKVVSQVIASA